MTSRFKKYKQKLFSSRQEESPDWKDSRPLKRQASRVHEGGLYRPLMPGEFRLVVLKPDMIGTSLITVTTQNAPPFEALSYLWGTHERSRSLACNGRDIPVVPNLYDALHTIQHPSISRLLWIDALCINQEDLEEKSRQIALMPHITSLAENTILWIGTDSEDTSTAFSLITQLVDARRKAFGASNTTTPALVSTESILSSYRQSLPPSTDKRWKSIEALLDQRLFQRVWTVPDLMLSSRLTIQWGHHEMPWAIFTYGLEAYASSSHPNVIKHPRAQTILRVEEIRRKRSLKHELSFDKIVDIFQPLLATTPQDRIFAAYSALSVLGVSLDHKPDYSKEPTETYLEAAFQMSLAMPQVPFLSLSLAGNEEQKRDISEQPYSWVPDFGRPHEQFVYRLNAAESAFNASRDERERSVSFPEFKSLIPRMLRFRSIMVDTIYQLAGPMPPRRPCDKFNVSSDNSFFFPEWYDWVESKAIALFDGDKQRLRLAWVETVQAKGSSNWNDFEPRSNADLLDAAEAWLEFLTNENREETESIRQFHAACLPSCGRQLGITKRGHLCLVPKTTNPGDLVCIPAGSKVPFVLRQIDRKVSKISDLDPNSVTRCSNVGECYVHGAMQGEAHLWEGIVRGEIGLV